MVTQARQKKLAEEASTTSGEYTEVPDCKLISSSFSMGQVTTQQLALQIQHDIQISHHSFVYGASKPENVTHGQ
jgi:hypothetical protein